MRYYCFLMMFLITGISSDLVNAADPLAWIPPDVNAAARIDVAAIYKSPLAQKEGWIKQAAESFIQQQSFIPPGTSQIVIGADLDIAEGLTSNRKFSVLVPDAGVTLEKLSPWLSGGIEAVSGKSLAQFGTDTYVADAGDGCWLVSSANRQSVFKWMKSTPTPGGSQLTRYLRTALRPKDNKAQVLLAIDLQDNFSPQRIADELKATTWFKSDAAAEQDAKIIASVLGVTIGLTVDQERSGYAIIDFGQETPALKPILDKLVDAVMHKIGIANDDIQDWKWSVKGTQILGSGPVTPGGGRRLMSILDPPSITHAISSSSAADQPTAEDRTAKTSLKYSKSIEVLLDDLRDVLKKMNYNHAVYFDRYARKIDELPKLHVDSALLDFAGKVSSSLRYQGQVQRMHNIDGGTRTAQTYASMGSFVGPYGWYGGVSNAGAGAVIDAQENQAAKSVRFAEWKQIEDGLAAVRRAMTEKYQIEF